MSGFLLSIDQGTTGSTALLLSPAGQILARANHEFPQHFPKPGWVEHDLEEIWKSVGDAVSEAIKQSPSEPFVAHHLNPVFKGQVGSDDQACPFVSPADYFKEEFCPCF